MEAYLLGAAKMMKSHRGFQWVQGHGTNLLSLTSYQLFHRNCLYARPYPTVSACLAVVTCIPFVEV